MSRRGKPAKVKVQGERLPARTSSETDGGRVRDLEKRLAESLEQQTATGEILRVISSSPTDVWPVFNTIARSAVRLCAALFSSVYSFDGEFMRLVAHHNFSPDALRAIQTLYPARPGRETAGGRAILDQTVIEVEDVRQDAEYGKNLASTGGWRSAIAVPMLHSGGPVGAIAVAWAEPGRVSKSHIELLKTFADQAVIAIENVRLFRELEKKNWTITEALEQQTATAEILRVISTSPTNLQPVLDTVVSSAERFCGAYDASLFQLDGEVLKMTAHHGPIPNPAGLVLQMMRGFVLGRAVLDRQPVQVSDIQAQDEAFPESSALAREMGYRTVLGVPLLRKGTAIGAIGLRRIEAEPFTDKQIALLQTFADQAVIAIENVRLFNETKEALERQTATSEILQVISSSPTDLQPVFDSIAERAVHLCDAAFGAVIRFDGEWMSVAAINGQRPEELEAVLRYFPRRPAPGGPGLSRVVLTSDVAHIPDVQSDPVWRATEAGHAFSAVEGCRAFLAVPLIREGMCFGAVNVWRREPSPFSEQHIDLLKTFADQAVIAIENVRLFTELQEKNRALTEAHAQVIEAFEQQGATSEVLQVISTFPTDVQHVFDAIVRSAVRLCEARFGAVFRFDGGLVHLAAHHNFDERQLALLSAKYPMTPNRGHISGRAILGGTPLQIADIFADAEYQSAEAKEAGFRSLLGVPIIRGGTSIGSIVIYRTTPGEFADKHIALLKTFADQAVIAIENFALFTELQARTQELEGKSRQLEAASQHKSEFLANMSHELRTPLNAVIGFSEVLSARMFGDLNEKQDEYLKDIHASGQHLLSLINDILDLSKIEAGRMELELSEFDLPQAIQNALTLVRERALRRGIALQHVIDPQLAGIRADERKVKQVLLNLLSNAIKFTPEGGRIEVRAVPRAERVEVAVTDTGIGIAPEDLDAIFEEFRQVGTADRKAEGTGLGLALARKFIELHGGRIWVESEPDRGSTFTFTLPVTRD